MRALFGGEFSGFIGTLLGEIGGGSSIGGSGSVSSGSLGGDAGGVE